jgi:hypothetical protein
MNERTYSIKKPEQLSDAEIKTILETWDVGEWKDMKPAEFRDRFKKSEFHLLTDTDSRLLSIARINFNFKVKIAETKYQMAELVGFVAVEILKGYGKELLGSLADNLRSRNIEAIGFCKNKNSSYYENCGLKIFYDSVRHLREMKDGEWFTPTEDDDIFSLTLAADHVPLFETLSQDQPAYLLFE